MNTAFYNGAVYSGELPLKTAFLVSEGHFAAVGTDEEILRQTGAEDRRIDLQGRFVCAGFNDSHMHLLNYGNSLRSVNLAKATGSLQALLSALSGRLQTRPPESGEWLVGRGWNQDYFSDVRRMPDRNDLDGISAQVPIRITRACGHCCVINSKALQLAGIDRNTKAPEGGSIGHDENGEPDGRLYENAIELLNPVTPVPDKRNLKSMLQVAMKEANKYGITSVQTDDYSSFRSVPWQLINEAYQELEREGKLTLRVTEQCNFNDPALLRGFIEAGNTTGTGSEFFRIGPLKLLGDGSLGSRTAHLSMPYLNTDGQEQGFSLFSKEELREMVSLAHRNGMSVAVHAIGDACLDEVLDAIEDALREYPRADHRHGIVHCQITRADQLERMARLKVHIYAQSIFLDYDNHIVRVLVPETLTDTSYSWKTLLRAGLTVSNGSDCPVELPDVMAGIQCAVTRCALDGFGPYLPDQAFTVQEALDSFTQAGARASFEETIKGRIQPGMLSDFVVLSQNPFDTEPEKLHEIKVLETWLGGKKLPL